LRITRRSALFSATFGIADDSNAADAPAGVASRRSIGVSVGLASVWRGRGETAILRDGFADRERTESILI
jgi:hypothetical protein